MKNILKLTSKFLISLCLIVIQIIFFIWLFNNVNSIIFFVNLFIIIISFIFALYIISTNISLETQLSWIVFSIVFPIASVLLYLFFHLSLSVSRLKKSLQKQELLIQMVKVNDYSILKDVYDNSIVFCQKKIFR